MSDNPQRDAERRGAILDWMRILLYACAALVLVTLVWLWNRPHVSHPIFYPERAAQLPIYWSCEPTTEPPAQPAPKADTK